MAVSETPMLDELEKGPWPSWVTRAKEMAKKKPACVDFLRQVELSYKNKRTYWKHGGMVGVRGYGGGPVGRYSELADKFPNVTSFHTVRVAQPSGWFYTTETLRKLCDIAESEGSGLLTLHGATGDIQYFGVPSEKLESCFQALTHMDPHFDFGGSGSDLRTLSCCVGPARCEFALYDTLAIHYDLTLTYQDEIHRPRFPYKFKIKFSGCPNDCVAGAARGDFAFIGIWRDEIQIDQEAVARYVKNGLDIKSEVIDKCPGKCIQYDGKLEIDNRECVRCMHCINVMPEALRPGKDRGAAILVGGKAVLVWGAVLGQVIVPFMKVEPPYKEIKTLLEKTWEWWGENGKPRERIAELIERMGLVTYLEAVGLKPNPYMVADPRNNPYIFFKL